MTDIQTQESIEADYLIEAFDEYVPWWGIGNVKEVDKEKWLVVPAKNCRYYFRGLGYEIFNNHTGEVVGEFDTLEKVADILLKLGFPEKKISWLYEESEFDPDLFDDVLYLNRGLNPREKRTLEKYLIGN